MRKSLLIAGVCLFLLYGAAVGSTFLPRWSAEGPSFSLDIVPELADPEEALTFVVAPAIGSNVAPQTYLVRQRIGERVEVVDPSGIGGLPGETAFELIGRLGRAPLKSLLANRSIPSHAFAMDELLPVAAGDAHVAFGTNFRGHGVEVDNEGVFAFPRFTRPTGSRGRLDVNPGTMMLDYEVEYCMRFDRDIATPEDFDAALKGVFLCGDFTDRAIMLRKMPPGEDPLSGIGFSDAKSLPGTFPTGPFLVVPEDWQRFVREEIVATLRNGELAQVAAGRDMVLSFRDMVRFALTKGGKPAWRYQEQPVPLAPQGQIRKGQTVLSGTGEGVIFRRPGTVQIATGVLRYGMMGYFLGEASPYGFLIEEHIESALSERAFLQPGEEVVLLSRRMGEIRLQIADQSGPE